MSEHIQRGKIDRFVVGAIAATLVLIGTAATLVTGYRSTTTLGTNDVAVIDYSYTNGGVLKRIHRTNFLEGLKALPNWPAIGTGDVTTAQLNTASNAVVAIVIANDITTSNGLVALLVANDATTSNALRTAFTAADTTTSNGVVTLLQANDITTSNGVLSVVVANDTTTSNALRTAYLAADITTSNGVLTASFANDMTLSNTLYGISIAASNANRTLSITASNALDSRVSVLEAGSSGGSSNMPVATIGRLHVTNAFLQTFTNIVGTNCVVNFLGPQVVRFLQTNHAGVIIPQNVPAAGSPSQRIRIEVIDVPNPTSTTNYSLVASNLQVLGRFDKIDGGTNFFTLLWTGSNAVLMAEQFLTTGTNSPVALSNSPTLFAPALAGTTASRLAALGSDTRLTNSAYSETDFANLQAATNNAATRLGIIEGNTNKFQIGSPALTNLANNPVPFTNIIVGSKRVALSTNAGVVTATATNPVVNFSGGSTGTGAVGTNQLDWLQVGGGTFRMTNASASNQVFQITNAIPGESVTLDCVGTNFTLTFVLTGISAGGEILWALNSVTNGTANSVITHTNSVVVLRCVETNRLSAVYANRRR